jgi:hypothetical protein
MTWPAAPSLPGLSYLHPSTSRFVKRCSAAADREQTTVQQQHQTATPSNTNTHAGTAAACQLVHLVRCRVRLLSLPAAVAGRGRRTPPLRAAFRPPSPPAPRCRPCARPPLMPRTSVLG